MKRKQLLAIIVMLTIIVSSAFCGIDTKRYNDSKFVSILDHKDVTYDDIVKVVDDYVPITCRDAFLYYTKCDNDEETLELMIHLLAVGQWESGWKVTISGTNKNGTVDLGYLALNSANAESKWFMSNFGPNEEDGYEYNVYLEDEYYLITCIKFYKYLYKRYGEDAAYCYNAGEGRFIHKSIPLSTYTYKKRVSEYVEKFVQESVYKSELRREFEETMDSWKYSVKVNNMFCMNMLKNKMHETPRNHIALLVKIYTNDSKLFTISDKNKRLIDDALNRAGIPNPEFICIGYIRKYGNHLAPVFKSKITGEKIVC